MPQRGTWVNVNRLRTEQRARPLDEHGELTMICMSNSPGSKYRRDASLLVFVRGVDKLNAPSCQDMPPEVYSQSPSTEQTMGEAQYYIEP